MRKALFSLFLALFTLVMFALPPGNLTAAGETLEMSITDAYQVPTESAPTIVIPTSTAEILWTSGPPSVCLIAKNNLSVAKASKQNTELDVYTPLKFLLTNQPLVVVGVFEDAVVVSQQNVVMFNERNLNRQRSVKAEAANFSPELYVSLVLV